MTPLSPSSIADRIEALPEVRRDEILDLLQHLETFAPEASGAKPTIFLSHVAAHIKDAVDYKAKLGRPAFLSSDWESLRTGGYWIQEIVRALRACQEFEALIFENEDFRHLWMSFELGVALGAAALRPPTSTTIAKAIRVICDPPSPRPPDSPICPVGDWAANASIGSSQTAATSPGFYLSHTLPATDLAAKFAKCICHMDATKRPVTTRSDHWKLPGSHCLNSVAAIQAHDEFFALIDVGCDDVGGKFDARSPWLNFEVGVAIGLGRAPVVFVHNDYLDDPNPVKRVVEFPLKAIFLLRTGDSNRRDRVFTKSGLRLDGMLSNVDWLLRQWNPKTSPRDRGPKRTDLPPLPPADATGQLRDTIFVPSNVQD